MYMYKVTYPYRDSPEMPFLAYPYAKWLKYVGTPLRDADVPKSYQVRKDSVSAVLNPKPTPACINQINAWYNFLVVVEEGAVPLLKKRSG
jgi:hypothetical protein